jgi:3-phenylpropionate/cinnamic acid dioxygenase small subunit
MNHLIALREEVTQFLYREARLQDEHRYADWEGLWTDDGVYWIPANGEGGDPEQEMSILYDNRSRIALRVRQLMTGRRLSQTPPSRLGRVVSNIELLETDGNRIRVSSNAMVFESSLRADTVWATRNEFVLVRGEPEALGANTWKMAFKKVVLVNNQKALFSMSFLL